MMKYEQMRDQGATPHEVYRRMQEEGVSNIEAMRLLRKVFGLTLVATKEVMVQANGIDDSLERYQERFLPGLEEALTRQPTSAE